jgi:hypothetical protein
MELTHKANLMDAQEMERALTRIAHEIIERTPATSYQIRVDIVQGTVVESEAANFSDPPAVDREKFAAYGWDEGGSFGFGTAILATVVWLSYFVAIVVYVGVG